MNIGVIDKDFKKDIIKKKKFLVDLIKYTNIDQSLIRKAINYMSSPPNELYLYHFNTPKIEELKKHNEEEYKKVIGVRKALSVLLNNTVITPEEKDKLESIRDRITHDYGLDVDRKALLDRSRDENDVNSIEDYKNYNDAFGVDIIDKHLKTDQQCEGKLITMLYKYLMRLAEAINNGAKPIDHQRNYNQKDVFELIAEILNLRWREKYNYEKIRRIYRNYQTIIP